mmetsp:Transcript_93917/g.166179  ORF Transcript_93917/g.166179 Transcript_93917/m.166179 type:complete len:226 (+) Transcript_93917:194-871(+)
MHTLLCTHLQSLFNEPVIESHETCAVAKGHKEPHPHIRTIGRHVNEPVSSETPLLVKLYNLPHKAQNNTGVHLPSQGEVVSRNAHNHKVLRPNILRIWLDAAIRWIVGYSNSAAMSNIVLPDLNLAAILQASKQIQGIQLFSRAVLDLNLRHHCLEPLCSGVALNAIPVGVVQNRVANHPKPVATCSHTVGRINSRRGGLRGPHWTQNTQRRETESWHARLSLLS